MPNISYRIIMEALFGRFDVLGFVRWRRTAPTLRLLLEVIMREEFKAKLGIFSATLTPDKLDSILGMKCDKGYLIGDRRGNTIIHEKENGWIVYSRVSRSAPLQDQICDVIERISPIKEMIGNIAKQPGVEVEFGCAIRMRNMPAIFFTKEQIAVIHAMGASIDIDLHLLPEDD